MSSEVLSDGVLFWLLSCGCYGSLPECQPLEILQSVGKDGAGEMEDDKCMVMEVEGAWNLAGMGMFSCLRAGIGMSVCVLVLVVVAVFAIVLGR